ncbi:hypothetical protein GP486_005406 [Trichoglossum hirsutum]|uniref:TATA element modulatory factor 1 TATA binding domain-containing protein n=1 Tax=Trichoglossum hirsutum TaxID=265104 RepID=A0A9P8RMA1_9PEZI|nr:hypothetical protein GP486_005406 [Trichoglossum hirsutum]
MASQPQVSKPSSRWGSFLQQAVAGVESKLDTILADSDDIASKNAGAKGGSTAASESKSEQPGLMPTMMALPTSAAVGSEKSLLRTPSNSKPQDRLQERLARAVVKGNNAIRSDSPVASLGRPPRTASPVTGDTIAGTESPRRSMDRKATEGVGGGRVSLDGKRVSGESGRASVCSTGGETVGVSAGVVTPATASSPGLCDSPKRSLELQSAAPSRQSTESSRDAIVHLDLPPTPENIVMRSPAEYESIIEQMRSDYESSELRRQEEVHTYTERIDALESKLQYLARESAEHARKASSSAEGGSLEKKLAEKDEKIASLMEEGQKLSKAELKLTNIIKKLRAKSAEDEKVASEVRKRLERAERDALEAKEKARRSMDAEKRANERLKALSVIEKEVDLLKIERDTNSELVARLQAQLAEAVSRAEHAETKVQTDALEAEKRLVLDLRDDITSAKIERELSEERHRAEVRELKERIEREKERAKMLELELRGEQSVCRQSLGWGNHLQMAQVLENKLEALRTRAEEVSTGETGDAQAHLLRQIETLQTQYAVASENWQGIEGTLLSRVSGLEKERDELSTRESQIRKKAREVVSILEFPLSFVYLTLEKNLKSKRMEEELEESTGRLHSTERDLAECKEQLEKLKRRIEQAEATLVDARIQSEQDRKSWEHELLQKLEEERNKCRTELAQHPNGYAHSGTQSPSRTNRKSSNADLVALQNRRLQGFSTLDPGTHSPISRRASSQQPHTSESGASPARADSLSFVIPLNGNSNPGTPSVHTAEPEEFFDGVTSPASQHRTINDMISASTAGAGPSVQLVERMSAAVRRLESEKAATKEELARLSAQRDEAREEVVSLMREVEQKRAADEKVKELEEEMSKMSGRYETTLEMLGEKSELVEELRADVADLKQMYRELVVSTTK